jgi:hypothetical protein
MGAIRPTSRSRRSWGCCRTWRPAGSSSAEDVAGRDHAFHSFVDGLTRNLSDFRSNRAPALPIHQHVASVHRYPLITVIEKPDAAVREFAAPKHGTEWQPFDPRSSDRLGKARR